MSTSRNCTYENRETSLVFAPNRERIGPGSQKHNLGMHAGEESNMGIVPMKLPNKNHGNTEGGGSGGKARDQGELRGI
jgi:hypothetical protein